MVHIDLKNRCELIEGRVNTVFSRMHGTDLVRPRERSAGIQVTCET